jgi:hypothetical protein
MEEHAAALRLMALTLCKPINTCFGLPTTQFYTAEAEDLESELQAKADAALSKLRKQVSAVESLHLIKMDQLARLNAKRNARMLAKGVYDDYNDLADAVQMHRAALKAAATDAARVTAIAAFMKDFDEDGQLFYSFFMPGTPRRLIIRIRWAGRLHHAQRRFTKARGRRVIAEASRVLCLIRWTGHGLAHATGNG